MSCREFAGWHPLGGGPAGKGSMDLSRREDGLPELCTVHRNPPVQRSCGLCEVTTWKKTLKVDEVFWLFDVWDLGSVSDP